MFPRSSRPIPAHLDVIPFTFETPPANLDWLACSQCSLGLLLHQPDTEFPSRMLGICQQCRRWHLILIDQDGHSAMLVVLPESRWFHEAWESNKVPDDMPEVPAGAADDEGKPRLYESQIVEDPG